MDIINIKEILILKSNIMGILSNLSQVEIEKIFKKATINCRVKKDKIVVVEGFVADKNLEILKSKLKNPPYYIDKEDNTIKLTISDLKHLVNFETNLEIDFIPKFLK